MIQAGLGRYGPYLKYQGSFTSLKDGDDLLEIGLNRAVDLLAESAKKRGRLLGEHPSGGEVHLKAGRFGPYVEHNKLRATLPRGTDMTEVELPQAIELLAAKAAKGGGTAKKGAAKKGTARKKLLPKRVRRRRLPRKRQLRERERRPSVGRRHSRIHRRVRSPANGQGCGKSLQAAAGTARAAAPPVA